MISALSQPTLPFDPRNMKRRWLVVEQSEMPACGSGSGPTFRICFAGGEAADLAFRRPMRPEFLHRSRARIAGLASAMKRHVTAKPLQIGLFRAVPQVPRAHRLARHLEQSASRIHVAIASGKVRDIPCRLPQWNQVLAVPSPLMSDPFVGKHPDVLVGYL